MGHSLLVAFLKETVDDSEREYVETQEDPGDEQEDIQNIVVVGEGHILESPNGFCRAREYVRAHRDGRRS